MPRLKEKFFEAQSFRKKGFSLKEISGKLGISKSTASIWLRDILLSEKAELRLAERITQGQIISAKKRKARTDEIRRIYFENGLKLVKETSRQHKDKRTSKIFCAILYWCEGAKFDGGGIQFTNSDPNLIRTFVRLMRHAFRVDESKFRVSLHVHNYHSISRQIKFWQGVTGIPNSQFFRPYKKINSGKRLKLDYQGCVNIKYYDSDIARQLLGVGKAFLKIYGGVV